MWKITMFCVMFVVLGGLATTLWMNVKLIEEEKNQG
jgi:hypothetical protein